MTSLEVCLENSSVQHTSRQLLGNLPRMTIRSIVGILLMCLKLELRLLTKKKKKEFLFHNILSIWVKQQ